MEKNCPKCGKKLSLFYVKETCNECGCNLMYYNMVARLEEDNRQAEAEFQKLEEIKTKLMNVLYKILPFLRKNKD